MKGLFYWISVTLIFISGCGTDELIKKTRNIGELSVTIEISESDDNRELSGLMGEAFGKFQHRMQLIQGADSEITKLNRERRLEGIPPELLDFLQTMNDVRDIMDNNWNPFMGGLSGTGSLATSQPGPPGADTVEEALDHINNTTLEIIGQTASIEGGGTLDPGRPGIGWALDGAADVLVEGGVSRGRISAGSISRFWGNSKKMPTWDFIIQSALNDSLAFRIEPEDGAVAILNGRTAGYVSGEKLFYRFIDPKTAYPPEVTSEVTVWADQAALAAALSEAMIIIGHRESFKWLKDRDRIGVLYIYPDEFGYTTEADLTMSPWLSSYNPR